MESNAKDLVCDELPGALAARGAGASDGGCSGVSSPQGVTEFVPQAGLGSKGVDSGEVGSMTPVRRTDLGVAAAMCAATSARPVGMSGKSSSSSEEDMWQGALSQDYESQYLVSGHHLSDQASGYCGLPLFFNNESGMAVPTGVLPAAPALTSALGTAVLQVLRKTRSAVVVDESCLEVVVQLRPRARTPDQLEDFGVCVELSVLPARGQLHAHRVWLWCAQPVQELQNWLVIGVVMHETLQGHSRVDSYLRLCGAILGLRTGGHRTAFGSLQPMAYNSVIGFGPQDGAGEWSVGPVRRETFMAAWSEAINDAHACRNVVFDAYRRLEGMARMEKRRIHGRSVDMPMSDVLHVGPGEERVAVCIVRVMGQNPGWECAVVDTAWCVLDQESAPVVNAPTAEVPAVEPSPVLLTSWGTIVVQGVIDRMTGPSVLRKALAQAVFGESDVQHVHAQNTVLFMGSLINLANRMGLVSAELPRGVGLHWQCPVRGLSGTIYVHYGSTVVPAWGSMLDRDQPLRRPGLVGAGPYTTKPTLAGELPGELFLTSCVASLGCWLSRSSVLGNHVHLNIALERTVELYWRSGSLDGKRLRCTTLRAGGCAKGACVAINVTVCSQERMIGSVSALCIDQAQTHTCSAGRYCNQAALLASVAASGVGPRLVFPQSWGHVHKLPTGTHPGFTVRDAHLTWPWGDRPYGFTAECALFSSDVPAPSAGWQTSLGTRSVMAAAGEQLTEMVNRHAGYWDEAVAALSLS
jgi:hypothetical protein